MSPNTKEWIRLIALLFGTGSVITVGAYEGGSKVWIAILLGLGTAGSNIYHAFSPKPGSSGNTQEFRNPNPPTPPPPTT